MIDLQTYYSQQLDNYNNQYTSYTTDYVNNYVIFKSDPFTGDLHKRPGLRIIKSTVAIRIIINFIF